MCLLFLVQKQYLFAYEPINITMIRISALNNESDEDSESEIEVTKEALEQIALQQYAKALDLQRKGNVADASQLLKDLLDTELLYDVKKPAPGEKASGPLFNLKYLCYKNLASMLSSFGDIDNAIEAYKSASDLDDTDVTLWHRLGMLCMQSKQYEMALYAFERGTCCNPRHWPCIDKVVTLLLGLDHKEKCISVIHEALQLDPDYQRGLVYRRHIYTTYHHLKDFMEYLNPIYKWDHEINEGIDEEYAEKLLKEAVEIQTAFVEQIRAEQPHSFVPTLKLKKPISNFSWDSVGDSLIHMHHYMTENCFSHACPIEIIFEKEEAEEPMEVCEEPKELDTPEIKPEEEAVESDKNLNQENNSENENNEMSDKDKVTTDTEKVESDVEVPATEPINEIALESKVQRRNPARRRSALSLLEQWEWCTKRRSGRKKLKTAQDRIDDNIYDTLRRMIPVYLTPEVIEKKQNKERASSPDVTDIDKLFIHKEEIVATDIENYFSSEKEQRDVKQFITKYTENKCDIIDILKEYLTVLAEKWQSKWPETLKKKFIEGNTCFNNHIDIPTPSDENHADIISYIKIHVLVEEFSVNEKFNLLNDDNIEVHNLSTIESIGIFLTMNPHIFEGVECLEYFLRYLWVKLHIHILNKCEEIALDCLYQLLYEFEAMGESQDDYNLTLINFTFKPNIVKHEIISYINFLERNKKLATVLELYNKQNYDEVLTIVIDSFEHCKDVAKKQQEMSLDFAALLSIILDTYWALEKVEDCFKWSFICLHEALKHYFRYTSGTVDYQKWTLAVVKVLSCMEHILKVEGLAILDSISSSELSQGLDDLIRIIGHQVETKSSEMPFGTVSPWIIMHYILQRQEDQGKGRAITELDKCSSDEVPNPLMLLFIAHEQLGERGWCTTCDAKLLFFTLDTVVPLLRSPALSKPLEQVCQYMEQCVYCLYGHPGKKNKLKYLADHNVTFQTLDWTRAQQVYEIFRPPTLPALEGKVSGITADTEQLFHNILSHLPAECESHKYLPEVEKYIKGISDKLPSVSGLLPYKMRDIYFLLGDYYFKREEGKMSVKYNMLDIINNNDRLESWAEISLAKALNLEHLLNSCKNINNEKEYQTPAKSVIRCFKRALELDPMHCNLWIEYGMFVYTVHSFCSRALKQASESLSMEDFGSLEKQKEEMLDTTQKCFTTVLKDLNLSVDSEKANEDSWLYYYMLGKVAEKRNKPPSIYLEYYMQAVRSLQETDATYPTKINYSSPTHLCIEVLELHYRIHASILKYIEQHENKPIPTSVGKVFAMRIEEWKKGPYSKKFKKDGDGDNDSKEMDAVHAANILKRSISDAGEEESVEVKKQKLESAAAKVRRSASYDTERITSKDLSQNQTDKIPQDEKEVEVEKKEEVISLEENGQVLKETVFVEQKSDSSNTNLDPEKKNGEINKIAVKNKSEVDTEKKSESSSSTSSSSSSNSSSSETSSESSSESSRDSEISTGSSNNNKPLSEDEIMKIVDDCLDALEDCASRFPPHYKAIYRLAHYHFYYKKGKNIERCRDLMLSTYTSRAGPKLGGMFSERKHSNFFNNIWKIPLTEVDRGGGFAFHMNRSVLLTMEILKEIDDHKTLLDLSLYLQRIPEPDRKYLRDSDREELAQQAFSLCVQSLKGQVLKFSQQADLKSNDVERQALNSLMLDIYRAYQRAQKQPNSKQFVNLLIDAYKLVTTATLTENMNLVDLSMKYCQSLIQALKQQATQASLDKTQNAQKKQAAKTTETTRASTAILSTAAQSKPDNKQPVPNQPAPKPVPQDIGANFQNYLPLLNDQVLSQQTAAALSYLNISALANYTSTLQNSLQSSLQNSFQAEFYRQFLGQAFSAFNLPQPKKQKRGPKSSSSSKVTPVSGLQIKSVSQPCVSSKAPPHTNAPTKSLSQNSAPSKSSQITAPTKSLSQNSAPSKSSQITAPTKSLSQTSVSTKSLPLTSALTKSLSQSIASAKSLSQMSASTKSLSQINAPIKSLSQTTASTKSLSQTSAPTKSISQTNAPTKSFLQSSNPSKSASLSNVKGVTIATSKSPISGIPIKPLTQPNISPKSTSHLSTKTCSSANSSLTKTSKSFSSLTKAMPTSVITSLQKSTSAILAPSMGTVLPSLPASMAANLSSFGASSSHSNAPQAHMSSSSTLNAAIHTKPPLPHQQVSPGKTLQEKLAERQKNMPHSKKNQEISSSLSRLPSSLVITKASSSKSDSSKNNVAKKALSFGEKEIRPKPISSDEVIVLDDD